ncbi:MAG: hypothetical protein ACYCOR_13890 [Acidobacteriaceae bacterium]
MGAIVELEQSHSYCHVVSVCYGRPFLDERRVEINFLPYTNCVIALWRAGARVAAGDVHDLVLSEAFFVSVPHAATIATESALGRFQGD